MSNIFLKDTHLGTLFIKNIYEFFEGPKLFSVTNEVDSLFVVYWIGDEEEFDKWIIVPVSKTRLEHFERKRLDINSILAYQEQKVCYQVNLPYDDSLIPEFIKLNADEIKQIIKMPKTGLFISSVTPMLASGKLGSCIEFSTHEIHVEKTSTATQPLVVSGVSKIFECFNNLYNSILSSIDEKDVMSPVSGRPGSFVLSFQAEKLESIEPLLIELNSLILHRGDLINFITTRGMDAQMLMELFQSAIESSSNLELKSNSTDDIILNVRKADAEFYIHSLAKLSAEMVGSYQVPQANIIKKVFTIVELKWQDKHLNLVSTGLDDRHILYYIHAAKILGFLNSNGSVSALGQQLAESSSEPEKQLRIAARSFEASHCGWAWITWSGAKNLKGVDPKTGVDFLMEKGISLSKKTKKRRGSTLRRWCEALQPFYLEI